VAQHPLVSTLFWVWNRLNSQRGPVNDPPEENKKNGEGGGGGGDKSPAFGSGRELGLMWAEEYGGHLDLYAEYVQDLAKGKPADEPKEVDANSGKESPFTRSPGWGWYMPITPPRDSPPVLPFGHSGTGGSSPTLARKFRKPVPGIGAPAALGMSGVGMGSDAVAVSSTTTAAAAAAPVKKIVMAVPSSGALGLPSASPRNV